MMWQTAHDAYLENRILSADPVELVRLLYHAAIDAVRESRRHLAAGDIRERSNAISRSCGILIELAGSLDQTRGGELSQRLAQLYDYMHWRLIHANCEQSDAPLAEVLGLLVTLSEAWDGLKTQQEATPLAPAAAWARYEEVVGAEASHAWSL
jgi:flagellar protein FliS